MTIFCSSYVRSRSHMNPWSTGLCVIIKQHSVIRWLPNRRLVESHNKQQKIKRHFTHSGTVLMYALTGT